jgi:hypothetical protein
MKKILISYGNKPYYKSLDLLEQTSLDIGKIDQFIRYTREWLEITDFYIKSKRNQYILNKPRGNGYWMWKPYIILETFKDLKEDNIVLYSDAGIKVIDNLNPLYKITSEGSNNGRMVFKIPIVGVPSHKAKMWTKRDCFILMNCDEQKYWDADMINGALSLWKKTKENIEFLNEWLEYLRDPRVITDDLNICGKSNFIEFREHRHDQSVLSLLTKKYEFEVYRDPTQWGNEEIKLFSNSPYGQLFCHHRKRL